MIMRQSLGLGDLLHLAGRFSLIARRANRNQPIGIVRIVAVRAYRQWRTMIEDDLAENHPRSAILPRIFGHQKLQL
jgi:hypothetical protein